MYNRTLPVNIFDEMQTIYRKHILTELIDTYHIPKSKLENVAFFSQIAASNILIYLIPPVTIAVNYEIFVINLQFNQDFVYHKTRNNSTPYYRKYPTVFLPGIRFISPIIYLPTPHKTAHSSHSS